MKIFSKEPSELLKRVLDFSETNAGKKVLIRAALGLVLVAGMLFLMDGQMVDAYRSLESVAIKDRNGLIISAAPNSKGDYAEYTDSIPTRIKSLLVKKEDRFFYVHPGFNPGSLMRSVINFALRGSGSGGSTITQQLTKNLLGHESNRTFMNKAEELLYSLALEVFESKERILLMYGNTIYMGNNIEGLSGAATFYFNKKLAELNDTEIVMLLSTISNPSGENPWKRANKAEAKAIGGRLGVDLSEVVKPVKPDSEFLHSESAAFELKSLPGCKTSCTSTIDKELTDKFRTILKRTVDENWNAGARNGVIIALKLPENEIIAMVGSPNPEGSSDGHSINMAIEPRPIGSTIKPFIYLEAFKKGLRPYSQVDDREYRFPIATGYSLYPKNYDGIYHGIVTLRESLTNSYNVPSVKTLEYIGLPAFYDFLLHKLNFIPVRDLDSYQYGIALGGLEMDPLTLAHYFTLFPNNGKLAPLRLYFSGDGSLVKPPMDSTLELRQVSDLNYVELINKTLNDRLSGVEQFGLKSNLNLSQDNYAVKTGTSRDYHDSWTVGYTPDFLVLVWLGNAENTALKELSGQSGAGSIWKQSMELLINSPYNKKTPFNFDELASFPINGNLEFGLPNDIPAEHRELLLTPKLILTPHQDDHILYSSLTKVPLRASKPVQWFIDDKFFIDSESAEFPPQKVGSYEVKALDPKSNKSETIVIHIDADNRGDE